MVFEVFPCLLLRKWQEGFAGPQQAVTLKQPMASKQPKLFNRVGRCSAQKLADNRKAREGVLLHALLTVHLPPPHLHPSTSAAHAKGSGKPLYFKKDL